MQVSTKITQTLLVAVRRQQRERVSESVMVLTFSSRHTDRPPNHIGGTAQFVKRVHLELCIIS